ncbi:MAG: diacylglycerol kinase family lipid kinase [Alphaproteobacteria bacterium]|nr:diacylglycerol kinase family lipid kinase [Alphaproteobacteria bacterium]
MKNTQFSRKRAAIVFNPTAGAAKTRRLDKVRVALEERGIALEMHGTTCAGDATRLAARIVAENRVDLVIAAGGDGTINEVANGLAGSSMPLAILPLGTANVLAAEIGVGRRAREIAEAIATAPIKPTWLGVANGRRFVLMAGVGFDAGVVESVDLALKRKIGRGAYFLTILRNWLRFQNRRYRVTVDGETRFAASAIISRARYYGGTYVVSPKASLDKDSMEVCLFLKPGRWRALRHMVWLALGRLEKLPDVEWLSGRSIEIVAADDLGHDGPVQGDGDVIARLPLKIEMSPEPVALVRP